MPIIRTHYSHRQDFVIDKERVYCNDSKHPNGRYCSGFKPHGFWYGIDNSWRSWCKNNDFNHYGKYLNIIDIGTTKLLRITSHIALKRFTNAYDTELLPGSGLRTRIIKWNEVTERYDGIEIAPYIWPARLEMDTFWYNPWDVASGCIWNMKNVTARKATKEEKKLFLKYKNNES